MLLAGLCRQYLAATGRNHHADLIFVENDVEFDVGTVPSIVGTYVVLLLYVR